MMNTQNNQFSSIRNSASADELNSVKKVFGVLINTIKNISLYPHGHTICENSIQQFHSQLRVYLHEYGDFRLEIDRDRIVSKGEVISMGIPDEGTLHFTLFRDGIRWLKLMDGIALDEIQEILIIIKRYTTLSSEPEGDLVTAFWEAQLPHMQYEAEGFIWGTEQEMGNWEPDLGIEKAASPLREKELEETRFQNGPVIDQNSLVLSPRELTKLQEMIQLDEDADLTSYVDVLLDSLLQHREEDNFNIIMGVLSEEFRGSLVRKEFMITLKILQGLRYVHDICKAEIPWAVSSIEDFFLTASGAGALSPLKEVWKHLASEVADLLGQVFKLLDPQAIYTLVLLQQEPQTSPLRQMLLDATIFLASRDMSPLESLLNNADDKIVEKLVPVIVNLDGDKSTKYLLKLASHPSERVRHEAVKGIFKRNPVYVKDIFNLIDDRVDSIRAMVFRQLGLSRDTVVEGLLLEYLKNKKINNCQPDHIVQCFRTLGQCGSTRSVPFLREALHRCGWMPGFWRSSHRRGAAIALRALGIPEAEVVLQEARRSMYPGLRGIVRKIIQESEGGGGAGKHAA